MTKPVSIQKQPRKQHTPECHACRSVLEDSLKLRLNMDKTRITHFNDGFIFLGHWIIRKRSRYGDMRVVSTIPCDCRISDDIVIRQLQRKQNRYG